MAGAYVNFVDPAQQCTALHTAIFHGQEQLARELILSGADVKAQDWGDSTPLDAAAGYGLDGIVSTLLLRGADKDALTDEGDSALISACGANTGYNGYPTSVDTLLSAGADLRI